MGEAGRWLKGAREGLRGAREGLNEAKERVVVGSGWLKGAREVFRGGRGRGARMGLRGDRD